jgi:ABC-type lipoprotein export system ATPase subunit
VRNLSKVYGKGDTQIKAIDDISFSVEKGEFVAIVGASGSGKSTVLNILAGLDTPSAGRADVAGHDLLSLDDDELVTYRRGTVGFVWQQAGRNLLGYLTATENVEVPMLLDGNAGKGSREFARELLSIVGLGHRLDARVDTMSGGEQQRVAIAVALANRPPILLADEPTGELDSHTADQVFEAFRSINRQFGTTIVVVTHDPAIASRVDRVVAIRDGRISTEIIRATQTTPDGQVVVGREEYFIVDRMGRVQLPREALEGAGIANRAEVNLVDDHIEVRPARRHDGRR